MRKSWKKASVIFMLLTLLAGCAGGCSHRPSPAPSGSGFRVVTGVTVTYQNGPIHAQRLYTNEGKMQQILNYLRLIDPYGAPEENPETAAGSDFRITISYSDGNQKTYRQKSDRFMLEEGGQWKKIDPSKAAELGRILGQMDSDP